MTTQTTTIQPSTKGVRTRIGAAAATLLALAGLIAVAGVAASQPSPGPVTRHDNSADIVPQAGPLEVSSVFFDFAPGASNPPHYHSGTTLNTVLAGTVTLRHAGSERLLTVGESWSDVPGDVHQVVNTGSTQATVSAVFVQPKGAMRSVNVPSLESPGPTLPRALPDTGDGSCEDDPSACE
jgi:quercetin dioxygenase-like cupin family protein